MQKSISLLLCVLLLASSTNITYAKHFCGDQEVLSLLTVGETFLSCSVKENIDTCNDKEQEENSCCKTKYENVDLDDNFENTSNYTYIHIPFIKSFVSVFVLPIDEVEQKLTFNYAFYDPPPINKDISLLYQVFII